MAHCGMPDWADKVAFMRQHGLVRAKWSDGRKELVEAELGPVPALLEENAEAAPAQESPKPYRPLAHAYPSLRRNSQFVKVEEDDA